MTGTYPRLPRIFAIQPSTRGFGWAVFEGPFSAHDWGVAYSKVHASKRNSLCVSKVDAMLTKYEPQTLVLEAYEAPAARHPRIVDLCRAVAALAMNRGVDVAVFTKQEVYKVFGTVGARTKHEIAAAIALHFEPLQKRLPSKRKVWDSEAFRMTIFSAAALILTYYRFGADQVFEDLRGASG